VKEKRRSRGEMAVDAGGDSRKWAYNRTAGKRKEDGIPS